MFVYVKTFLLYALVDTQAMQFLDAIEQSNTTGGSPKVDDENSKQLSAEESPTITVESTV